MGCDNCADLGHTDDAGEVTCPECNGTGNVTEQREADRKLGAAVRAYFNKTGFVALERVGERVGVWHTDEEPATMADTLDEAVTRAGEGL